MVEELLKEFDDILSKGEFDVGRTQLVEHLIDTGSHRPIRQPLRRHPVAHLEIIDEKVEEMLRSDIIEPAASPWASNVVLVRKKGGSYRFCVDYRSVNSVTYKDAYPTAAYRNMSQFIEWDQLVLIFGFASRLPQHSNCRS